MTQTMTEAAPLAGIHMRALIRRGVVKLLKADAGMASLCGARIYGNRVEHWYQDEYPAAAVYALSESNAESDVSPDPDERALSLNVELVAAADERLDDVLDALCLALERAVGIDALGQAMTAIVNRRLPAPLPVDPQGRSPVDAALLRIRQTGSELGIAVDGQRQLGVATVSFEVEYRWPVMPGTLADFLLAVSGWDVEPADGCIDMQSRVEFSPITPATPEE